MPLSSKRTIKKGREGVLPNGVYRLIIEACEEKPGPSGHPYYNFRLRPIVKGEKSSIAVWDKVSLSPEARFRVENLLDAMEIGEDEDDLEPEFFIGKSYWASLGSREYQGKWSNEVKQYLTPEAAEDLLQKQAESTGFSADADFSTERKNATPAAAPARAKAKSKVSELTDEASPF